MTLDPEFRALRTLSAKLGRDPDRVQAAGGNTSLKRDGVMWIKASGTWLAAAEDEDILVPVRLDPLLQAMRDGDPGAETARDFVLAEHNPRGLRPSIETTVHAVLPFAVVLHVHCVSTIALALRADAELRLAERLDGIDWAFVPYCKPGLTLSHAIAAQLRPGTNVVVLGNHGLVVAADDVAAAGALLDRVCAALALPRRSAPPPQLAALSSFIQGTAYRLPQDPVAHDAATDRDSLALATAGAFYPDHVIFLGAAIAVAETPAALAALDRRDRPPAIVAVPGRGVLLHQGVLRGADEMARCLADVAGRVPANAPTLPFSPAQVDELTNWDAEKYRQSLSRRET
ncbi:rhamnose utilization protein RhaD (predicted bifunctional aldolase and dehydrogenase) [Inquilinus ginsengisoli]|uniref:Rhamnose utilization protein RhaD (Predicted bifunctional aldolase and dehydrogenase) n=1 Tax=Inquilinus ginsengisoli TaxID=363840 RepID=A0ABU1K0L0_9PROT|nr:class II aldolase/adducin family protein [Inquilinus ginsengisoli]MDR6294392.1 rhamnose utilization protein RhaD (predicted bifunctional aldolase and dehydrogenase) [Inquilinus ginsengisoli]